MLQLSLNLLSLQVTKKFAYLETEQCQDKTEDMACVVTRWHVTRGPLWYLGLVSTNTSVTPALSQVKLLTWTFCALSIEIEIVIMPQDTTTVGVAKFQNIVESW